MAWRARMASRPDVALAAGLAVLANAELLAPYPFEHTPVTGPSALHFAFATAMAALLALRRVYPLVVAPAVSGLFALQAFVTTQPNVWSQPLILVGALYSLMVYAPTWASTAAPAALSVAFAALLGSRDGMDPVGAAVTDVLFASLVVAAGAVVRQHRSRAERLRRERDEADARARRIAAEERVRIARELHDVVSHGMSVVVLQARGGRRILAADPAGAAQALDDIERVAAGCLAEMRRLLSILRDSDARQAPMAPQPRLSDVDLLVEQAQASGASVRLVVEGEPRELSPAVELSGYRIVQEALTNALRHAPGSRTDVRLDYRDDEVSIAVTDEGPGGDGAAPGHGLIGMRERAELFGGTFAAGNEPEGGFGVRARLPVGAAP